MSDPITAAAEAQFRASPEDAADRAHVLEKLIGFERDMGRDTSHLERVLDALYGHSTATITTGETIGSWLT